MSATPPAGTASLKLARSNRQSDARKRADRFGDVALRLICLGAAVLAGVVLVLIAKEVFEGAQPAISKFGFSFITHQEWAPPLEKFGGEGLILGTLITSAMALFIGAPVAISIGIFLALLAPAGVRNVISPLVEMLAAIPSVILGFWGVLILGPVLVSTVEPFLHNTLGFIPLFGAPQTTGASIFTAGPDPDDHGDPDHRLGLPRPLHGGPAGAPGRRRGARLDPLGGDPRRRPAVDRLGDHRRLAARPRPRAGRGDRRRPGGRRRHRIHLSLFKTGGTMASIIALQFPSAVTALHTASLYYLAALLLVIGVVRQPARQLDRPAVQQRRGGDAMSSSDAPTAPRSSTRPSRWSRPATCVAATPSAGSPRASRSPPRSARWRSS